MKKPFLTRAKQALAVLNGVDPKNAGREAKALMIEAGDQTLETPYGDIAVGDPVMKDGAEVTDGSLDGTYTLSTSDVMTVEGDTLAEGSTIEVVDNMVATITPAEGDDGEGGDGGDGGAENMTVEELQAKLKEETEAREAAEARATEAEAEAKEVAEAVEAAAKNSSNWTPPRAQASFKPAQDKPGKSFSKDDMNARRESYKNPKKR